MLGFRSFVLCAVLAIGLTSVNGLSDEEKGAIKALVLPFLAECGKDYGVTEEEIKAAKEAGTLKDLNPCLISCVFKKVGIFDSKGQFDEEKATELTTKFLNDGEEQKKALEVIHTCSSVNEQAVNDGDKGCERATLMIECYMPLKGKFPGAP
ncbi:general odorant-binding protein 28a-like [Epargyreus clarus]|uniref:general odorant-binding protein 28a-like n=1 Tax=Epargyreus clarus TaxID=520877 RepID=UPI003C2DCBF0